MSARVTCCDAARLAGRPCLVCKHGGFARPDREGRGGCQDCGQCDDCIEVTRAHAEEHARRRRAPTGLGSDIDAITSALPPGASQALRALGRIEARVLDAERERDEAQSEVARVLEAQGEEAVPPCPFSGALPPEVFIDNLSGRVLGRPDARETRSERQGRDSRVAPGGAQHPEDGGLASPAPDASS